MPLILRVPRLSLSIGLLLIGASIVEAAIPAWLAPITQSAQPFLGVTHYQITQSLNNPSPAILPRELSIHIVEIDPSTPGISFLGTPGNGAVAEEYTRQTTSSFVNSQGLAVGINGDFYTTNTGANASVNGLGMSNGSIASPAASGWASFIVRQNNTAVINTSGAIPSGARNAVSGNQHLVRQGVNIAPNDSYTTTLNPHTAIGVNSRNGHVFFMTVDGRQTDFSEGMRTDDMADMLIDFGVTDAINLDGGGSSTMVFADGPGGAARTVNSPSDGSTSQQRGSERSVANHFGIFATPNPAYTPLPRPPRPQAATPDPLIASLTILDPFDGGEGRFTSTPFTASGSTNGITAESIAVYSTEEAQAGDGSQQITMVRNDSSTARLRHLSGGGSPSNNRVSVGGQSRAMGPNGFVGFFLKTTDADLQVGIGIDDGASGGSTGMEISNSLPVIADGQWHLYEWNLDDADQWSNFSGGNGTIDGPNAYIDSVFIHAGASTAGETLTMFLDTVAYNPFGSLAELVPDYPADFNGDGRVDGDDLATWRNNFGADAAGDADQDGDVDGADFLQWQQQLGSGAPSTVAATQVPEPHIATLLSLLSIGVATMRTSRAFRRFPA
jgi:hypothetical protein